MSVADGEVCIPNIGPRERAKRMRTGIIGSVATAAVAATLIAVHAPRWTRLVVFMPAIVAAYGVFQAREKT
jgi:uncharacterized protein (DUF983 family)